MRELLVFAAPVAGAILLAGALLLYLLKRREKALIERGREMRRLAEQARSEVEFQTGLLDAVAQAVIATDADGRISYFNRYAEALYGWSKEEAVGSLLLHLTPPPETLELAERAMKQVLAGGGWSGEIFMRRKDGTRFPALLIASPLRDAQGRITGSVSASSDITERLRNAEEQRFLALAGQVLSSSLDVQTTLESIARLAVPILADYCIVDVLTDGSVQRLGAAHRERALEPVLAELLKYPPEMSSNAPAVKVLRSGEPALVNDVDERLLETLVEAPAQRAIIDRLAPKSLLIVPIIARNRVLGCISFVSTRSGRYTAAELTLAEELARRAAVALENAQLYAQAQAANQAKSDFLAVVSHELRTPLTTIMGYTDLLLAGVPDSLSKGAHTYVERVRKAAWHLLGLIEQILIYARMEAGRDEVHPMRIELGELAKETAALIEPIAAEKGLIFEFKYPPPPAIVETDLTKVRQILLNLLSNAVKYTDSGRVSLEVELRNGKARFCVMDTGQGIGAQHVEKIFDPFWQVEDATTRSVGGAGLGLSVTRRLARLLGGDVHVVSAPGTGSTFVVELPTRYSPPPP
jgi:PAS domain S-box-containing protein